MCSLNFIYSCYNYTDLLNRYRDSQKYIFYAYLCVVRSLFYVEGKPLILRLDLRKLYKIFCMLNNHLKINHLSLPPNHNLIVIQLKANLAN